MLDISSKEFRNKVISSFSEILEAHKYKWVQSQLSFVKKNSECTTQVAFDFINYYPDSYEFRISYLLTIYEIEKVLKFFFKTYEIEGVPTTSIVLHEADFKKEFNGCASILKSNYGHSLSSAAELTQNINDAIEVTLDRALPLINTISSLKGFQSYIQDQTVINSLFDRRYFFLSALIASHLEGIDNFENISKHLSHNLELSYKKHGTPETLLLNYFKQFHDFVNQQKST